MTSVYVKTLGCKVNSFDSNAMTNQFLRGGYTLSPSSAEADITVINTCSVTASAEKDARYWLRRSQRENPKALRVVTGCYAQIDSASLLELDEVDFVVPNEVKHRIVPLVQDRMSPEGRSEASKLAPDSQAVRDNKQGHFKSALLFDNAHSTRTRAFVKIQDGCNGFCSYCQIPYARGVSSSVDKKLVLDEIERLVRSGVAEIVLTGIHIGDYGEDLDSYNFEKLLQDILVDIKPQRLRISSLEPAELSPGIIKCLAEHSNLVCDHFHLPLQSGSDKILKLMRRKYDTKEYKQIIQDLREFFPKAHVSADVICGFPGETEQEFQETKDFIKSCDLNSLHVFSYSKRPNTAALRLPGHVDQEVIKKRVAALRALSQELFRDYSSKFLGSQQEVLWEKGPDEQGFFHGKTKNYLNVMASSKEELKRGQISNLRLKGFVDEQKILGIVL